MADALDLLDKIRAKHDRLAAEETANPRTEWPAGVILFEGGDDGLPPRPADALDEARGLLARAVEAQRAAREAHDARLASPLSFALREWMAATHRYNEAHAALWDGAPPLLPALCDELTAAREELALLREYHEATEEAEHANVLYADGLRAPRPVARLDLHRRATAAEERRTTARAALAARKERTK
ncbi:MAG: hypothetical protein RIS45_1272 [Planctomycetota bacterium]